MPLAQWGPCLHQLHSPWHQRCTALKTKPLLRADQSPASLLPELPRFSFTIPQPASQIKQAATDPTPPKSPTPAAGSALPSPSQSGEPFVPDLNVSTHSTDFPQLSDRYEAQQ